ncbi:hypothetical protein ANN_22471 [Periplaneta americana]|uniref:Transposable element Tcb1 transposase n=1 Tax=Periplaneta americana TaxID=6978 RepID=A0ABQ8S885_PERAM|nr:hypothetical protein ANN_22471 [Periplaneta americana]
MADRPTVREQAQIAAHYEVWNSVVLVQRWWRMVKERNATIHPETRNCHRKLMTTGSIKDAGRTGCPSTFWSEENVAIVWEMFDHSLDKSTSQAACESGLKKYAVHQMLQKELNNCPWKCHYVQQLTPKDCDHRMEHGELMPVGTRIGLNFFKTSSGVTRPDFMWEVSSIDTIAIIGQHKIPDNLNSNRYIREVSQPEVLPLLQATPHAIFQEDNARPYVVRIVQAFFEERRVSLFPWPAHYPDMSPIEHVWDMVGRQPVRHGP